METSTNLTLDAAKIAAEFFSRNSDSIIGIAKDIISGTKNQISVRIRSTYDTYITSATNKYGKAKSFFIRDEPTYLYNFYVPLDVKCGKNLIKDANIKKILKITNRIIISAPAGSGKSMLSRHFLLSSLSYTDKIPVFIELRSLNTSERTVYDLIFDALNTYGFSFDEGYIEVALQNGHFVIILDGFDEINFSLRESTADDVLGLSRRYSGCPIIISSRPDDIFENWEEFHRFNICPLSKEKAVELVDLLPYDEEIKKKFGGDLKDKLYKDHQSFLSNPLLLSIMLLTYGQSANIPNKLSVFFNQAYEALFQRHDALKGGFRRDRFSSLDIQDFSRLFSVFCIQTYDKRIFQMSMSDATSYVEKSIKSLDITVDAEAFIKDAMQSVCLLVEDGLFIVFALKPS